MQILDIKKILIKTHIPSVVKVETPSEFVILLVRISSSETQSFLLSRDLKSIYLSNSFWGAQVTSIVSFVLHQKGYIHLSIDRHVVLLGVWHFGHLLGDHSWNILVAHNLYSSFPLIKFTDSSGFDISDNLLLDGLLTQEIVCDACLLDPSDHTLILPPSFVPSHAMSMSSTFVRSKLKQCLSSYVAKVDYVFLTSDRDTRIANISEVRSRLQGKFLFVNPLNFDVPTLYSLLATAKFLVSENGSILFNIFLSRSLPYYVLASERCKLNTLADDYFGGYIYNEFHDSLIKYLYTPCMNKAHHPYSDQISIGYNLLNFLLSL